MITWATTSCSLRCSLAYLHGWWHRQGHYLLVDCWQNTLFHDGWIPGDLPAAESDRLQRRKKGSPARISNKPIEERPGSWSQMLVVKARAPATKIPGTHG